MNKVFIKRYIPRFYSLKTMSFKSPKITVDGIIIKDDKILLIKRKNEPFKDKWALPGGFVEYNETVEDAVIREIFEETGLQTNIDKIIGVYSDPKRDPRGHTITIAYLLKIKKGDMKSGDDALDVKFFSLNQFPPLSFDHDIIINDAIRRKK